jgi:hypothetical protein
VLRKDRQLGVLPGGEKCKRRLDPGLDRHEAEPEGAGRGAGLAALVGDLGGEPVAVADALDLGVALVRCRRERDREPAVGVEGRGAGGHDLGLGGRRRRPPEPPLGRAVRGPPATSPALTGRPK